MNHKCIKVGPIRTNCYILEKDDKVIVIDPGDEYNKIRDAIGDNEVLGVFVTHHHYDHVDALMYFDDKIIYDFSNLEEGIHKIGPFEFEVIYTPGHKEDCITLYFIEEKMMFTGDFLFYNTIGRTDLPGSNMDEMIDSLIRISKYPANIEIYPGHGRSSILGNEIENNKMYTEK